MADKFMTNDFKNVEIKLNPSLKNIHIWQRVLEYACISVFSVIFLMLFSLWTSPLYKYWYGCDASFFTMVGRGITEGLVPYRDFYDLKGPYFFFIEAFGQLFASDRIGAFVIQVPFLSVSAILMYEIAQFFTTKGKALFILLTFYACHIATLWGGNCLEEYALTLSLLCLFLFLKDYKNNGEQITKISFSTSLILGITFGIMTFSKISVSAPVLAIIATIVFCLVANRSFKEVALFILYVLTGIATATLPVLIYFSLNDSLSQMFHCVFEIGFTRSIDYGEIFNAKWELKCSGCIAAFIFALTHRRRLKQELAILLMAMSAGTYLLLHLGTPFYYYFITVYPTLVLAMALFFNVYNPLIMFANARQTVCVLLYCLMLSYFIPAGIENVQTAFYDYEQESYDEYQKNAEEIAALIPEFERDDVFSFMIDMTFFEATQIMPCNKYQVNLPYFTCIDPPIIDELLDTLNNNPMKWLVIGEYFPENHPEFAEVVEQKYDCIYENGAGKLYLLRE